MPPRETTQADDADFCSQPAPATPGHPQRPQAAGPHHLSQASSPQVRHDGPAEVRPVEAQHPPPQVRHGPVQRFVTRPPGRWGRLAR
ncbi:hypothetical protein [Actinomyces wuliandei]|uniref:hypothetical protein n=1 Tax=Actinomyces wuliandei TaxID=2057743 RepID=UPI00111ABD73|nr:hypothetical protein [Actinomyces wuliandei]